ncbi:peptidylprolyl isomerase [Malaciobacter pacificus]|uniref:Putative periplasmic folding chaperone n=1 Tax=Malaciobacter pacificus TaxID=1080223 RepID=A0A5C2H7S9_9BACT|nr:peptidylprolyl isomerase [Malaciobacter pacificus]QEP34389.1 putative periplasmic folding chaperone [Malaciobacter pacificus]GGD37893.1 peptidylprolyl isomerase [Malaciobacter pacificus]
MISWMQRHKKWLVITIWISTIAFVGAGFVGWGSYDYGKQGGVVAVVGDREVSVEEYQEEYSRLYDQYARTFGSMFNQEMADKLNLKDIAYNQTIQKNLILSYADSLGLDVTNEDIAKELVKYNAFVKDGKFDKDTYIKVLAQNRTTPAKFEDSLKRGILLQKVQALFEIQPTNIEVQNLSKILFIEDDIEYKVISSNEINVEINEEELKKYWEENKNRYLSEVSYELLTAKIPLESSNPTDEDIQSHYDKFKLDYKKEDGKIKSLEEAKTEIIKALDSKATKTKALKEYLNYKKGDSTLETQVSFKESQLPYSSENNTKISQAKVGELIKPFLENDEYVIVKVTKINEPKPLEYADAKALASKDYSATLKEEKLNELANEQLKTFQGTVAKGITRESLDKIDLDESKSAQFLSQLFASTSKEGVVKFDDSIVLYRVLDSRLGKHDASKDELVKQTLVQMQDQELMTNLIKSLETKFEIQSSIQTKDQ